MGWFDSDQDDTTIYTVVVNHEEQYSIWPTEREIPAGWTDAGKTGPRAECLEFVSAVWTDMRPLSLRKKMEEFERTAASHDATPDTAASHSVDLHSVDLHGADSDGADLADDEESLVDRLCRGTHPVEISLRPEKTLAAFKACLEAGYVHVTFTGTQGGTELGLPVERDRLDLTQVDFERGVGSLHLAGSLTLDYVNVRCIADIALPTLGGTGHLEREPTTQESR